MFLSRLVLAADDHRTPSLVRDLYRMHQALLWAFPRAVRGGDPRLLYRVEPDRGPAPVVLVQSATAPAWDDPRLRAEVPALEVAVVALAPDLPARAVLGFRLRANPTVKRAGKRQALAEDAAHREWLERKLASGGLALVEAVLIDEGKVTGRKAVAAAGRRVLTFRSVWAEGTVRVDDPSAAWHALQRGVGPAKAFGFGLLSLERGKPPG